MGIRPVNRTIIRDGKAVSIKIVTKGVRIMEETRPDRYISLNTTAYN